MCRYLIVCITLLDDKRMVVFFDLVKVLGDFTHKLQVIKEFLGDYPQYRIDGNGQDHSDDSSLAACSQDNQKNFQGMSFHTFAVYQGLKQDVVEDFHQQEGNSHPSQQGQGMTHEIHVYIQGQTDR